MENLLEREKRLCFLFFYDNFSRNELTFGLMPDCIPDVKGVSSVASTGFFLAALAIGAESGYITRSEAAKIFLKTAETLLNLPTEHGFYYHFYFMDRPVRQDKCELSSIDTALLYAGLLAAGSYFGDECQKRAEALYALCDWTYFYDDNRKMFHMAKYDDGFSSWWDFYAEQLILYVLSAGAPRKKFRVGEKAYYAFTREKGSYGGEEFIYSWYGSLFTYQYSHAFVDFRNIKDANGTDWFRNSVEASLANRRFCIAESRKFSGYGADSWGLTACSVKGGYSGALGAPPSGLNSTKHLAEGTVAPAGALGSLPFTPAESLSALQHYYAMPEIVGKYGLYDSFNRDILWCGKNYIGIDKGITIVMAENYQKGTVWNSFGNLSYVKKALSVLGFVKEEE